MRTGHIGPIVIWGRFCGALWGVDKPKVCENGGGAGPMV